MTKDIEREAFDKWHFLDWKLNCAVTDTVEEARKMYERIYKPIHCDQIYEREECFKAWKAATNRAEKKLEGCVVVHESELETCYYDEYEGMYLTNHDFLKNIDAGEVVEVKRQYYWETTPLFAAITWDELNKKEGSFQIFKSHDEAEKVAAHYKAMLEAARGGNE